MYCTKCGKKLKVKDKFCTDCGKPVFEEASQIETNKPAPATIQQKTNPVPFIIVGVVLGGAILFIVFFVILFMIGVYDSIEDYAEDYNYKYEYDYKNYNTNVSQEIVGDWESAGGSYFVFKSNKTFYWYKTKEDLKDNYYYGYMEVKKGEDALKELGISESRVSSLIDYNGKISKNSIYSVKLYPTFLIVDGVDKTKENLTKGSSMKLLFVKLNTQNAEVYNFKTGDIYHLELEGDTI